MQQNKHILTLRVNMHHFSNLYYKYFDTPCHYNGWILNDTECQNVYNSFNLSIAH